VTRGRTSLNVFFTLIDSTLNGIYAKKQESQAAAGDFKADVLQAMFYLRNAWNKVSAETIQTCLTQDDAILNRKVFVFYITNCKIFLFTGVMRVPTTEWTRPYTVCG